jgi:hypothetical protein
VLNLMKIYQLALKTLEGGRVRTDRNADGIKFSQDSLSTESGPLNKLGNLE